jgi:hypothetical protein
VGHILEDVFFAKGFIYILDFNHCIHEIIPPFR